MADEFELLDDEVGDIEWADDAVDDEEEVEDVDWGSDGEMDAAADSEAEGGKGEEDDDGMGMFGVEDVAADEFMAVKPWLGAIVPPSDYVDGSASRAAPAASLELDWVYGYACRDSRGNVAFTADGSIAYPAASLGVLYDSTAHSQRYLQGHTDDVKSLATDGERRLLATGQLGRKPTLRVWDAASGECAAVLGGHRRRVIGLAFSPDSSLVASVGQDSEHTVLVHDWASGATVSTGKCGTNRVLDVEWDPFRNVLVTMGVNHMKFWAMGDGGELGRARQGLFGRKGKRQPILCAAFTRHYTWSGTAGGQLYIWRGNSLKSVFKAAHRGKVTAIASNSQFVVSGGDDGAVRVFSHKGKPLRKLAVTTAVVRPLPGGIRALDLTDAGRLAIGTRVGELMEVADVADDSCAAVVLAESHYTGELWGLSVHPEENLAVTACEDNTVRVWDIEAHRMISKTVLAEEAGKRSKYGASTMSKFAPNQCARAVDWHWTGSVIAVGCNDGSFQLLDYAGSDGGAMSKLAHHRSQKRWIQDVKFDPAGDLLAVAGHSNTVEVWERRELDGKFDKLATFTGHNAPVTHVDWSEDGTYLHSNCLAYELLFFSGDDGEHLPGGASAMRDEAWATWTLPIGWPVRGIWPSGADGSHINAVARSSDSSVLATADDDGLVKLFAYPAAEEDASFHEYRGHSSHVTKVAFTFADEYLLSAGGNDGCLFVWRTTGLEE